MTYPDYADSGSTAVADDYGSRPSTGSVRTVLEVVSAIFRERDLVSPLDDPTRLVSDDADEIVIALQTRQRLDRAAEAGESYWTPLGDVLRDMGHDPAEFGLE